MRVTAEFNAHLPVKITKRKSRVLASCSILDVHAQGDTVEQAKKNLGEALTLFFISCFERGTLDAVLKQCGFRAIRFFTPPPKKPVVEREDYISVPIPFLVDQTAGSLCHA